MTCGPLWRLQNEGKGSTQVKAGEREARRGALRGQKDREVQGECALASRKHIG